MTENNDFIDYNEANTWERLKYSIRTWRNIGVGKSLFIWFLVISFVPLAAVSFINFLNAYQGLTIVAEKSLNSSSQLRLKYIYTFFSKASDFLEISTVSKHKRSQFEHLLHNFHASGLTPQSYVQSANWKKITQPLLPEIEPSLKLQGFYDFLFLDNKGNILFSTRNESDLGESVFGKDLRNTRFARTVKESMDEHKMLFSDLEHYAPSLGIISGFFVRPVKDSSGNQMGVFVLQITMKSINGILQQEAGYGKTGQAFLIGEDLLLRSATRFGNASDILEKRIVNKKTLAWRDYLQHRDDNAYLKTNELEEERVTTYDADGKGTWVLGIYRNLKDLEKFGVHWALIEEISHSEAFAYARKLSDIVKLSFLITMLVVIFISIMVTRWFVNPIKALSSWGKQISTGYLVEKNIKAPQNEIGEMTDTFNKVVVALKTYSDVAKLVAKGDLSESVEERGKDDVLARSINKMVESFRSVVTQANRIAEGDYNNLIKPRSENDSLGKALFKMTETLRKNDVKFKNDDWLKSGLNEMDGVLKGKNDLQELSQGIISFFTLYLKSQLGLVYLYDEESKNLHLSATYALSAADPQLQQIYESGEGLVGQSFKDKKSIIVDAKDKKSMPMLDFGAGKKQAHSIAIVPFSFEDRVIGIMVIGSVNPFSDMQLQFLELAVQDLALAVITLQSHLKVRELLMQTQEQAKILEVQQEELRQANEDLKEQTEALKRSEESLQTQQEELKVTNEELEERTKALEIQRDAIKRKNKELEEARKEIEKKAYDLEQTNRYKSEFLANMSHELRTPLNSIIVLSQLLNENKNDHLSEKEKEFARTVNSSGIDLLNLINDILDLSKVESGKVEVNVERLYLDDLVNYLEENFKPIVEEKGLSLKTERLGEVPPFIDSDLQKIQQVIKNLISNAIKFTESGSITLRLRSENDQEKIKQLGINAKELIALSVVDTGIGIPKDKQDVIFEAFKQADGTTSRKYGGTGLGLSISRSFSHLLGGAMELKSEENKGAEFILYLPLKYQLPEGDEKKVTKADADKTESAKVKIPVATSKASKTVEAKTMETIKVKDDRYFLTESDKKVLIIEDDKNFTEVLFSLAHEHGFKAILAADGETGLYHADYYQPDAIILDIGLPGIDGKEVLDLLKENVVTNAIPVHVISAGDFDADLLKKGAIGYLSKPVNKEQLDEVFNKLERIVEKEFKKLLVVEDEAVTRKSIENLLKDENVNITSVDNGGEAIDLLTKEDFDCMILDLGLKDMTGFDVLEQINTNKEAKKVPVVIYTGNELSKEEDARLQKYSQSIVLKGARSFERLLDETTQFLHQVDNEFGRGKKKLGEKTQGGENILKGKTILLVDDDMRNVFALSSVLETYDVKVVVGRNGIDGIEKLHANEEIDLILMDIMMPEMDGYEAMRLIRKEKKYEKLPMIALTAKAMKGDREKCLAAGANEYLSKPVEREKLISLLRVWLYR